MDVGGSECAADGVDDAGCSVSVSWKGVGIETGEKTGGFVFAVAEGRFSV